MKVMMNQQGYATVYLNSSTTSSNTVNVVPTEENPVVLNGEPASSDVQPVEGEAVPVEGDAAPVEGDTAPVEGDAAPVEGDAAPVEGDAAPVEGDAAPVEGDAAPIEGEAQPMEGMPMVDGMEGDMGMMGGMEQPAAKGSVMSSWPFVIGISAVTLAISVVLGILLAKKRIKKGFDLYED